MRLNYKTIWFIINLALVSQTLQVNCFNSFAEFEDQADNEISAEVRAQTGGEIYLLEDKDYPRSLFEDYTKHVGQVSGISAMPGGDVVIFHRANRHWTNTTFDGLTNKVRADKPQDNLIKNNTIMIVDRDNGSSVASFGADLFYLPHGVASDAHGNLWLTDVGRHQVMRLPAAAVRAQLRANKLNAGQGQRSSSSSSSSPGLLAAKTVWPDIILGRAFEPGDDEQRLCQPSEVAVSRSGRLVFVADGYCNRRVVVFTGEGRYLRSFGRSLNLQVVHSLTLIEERNLVCLADRENARILCFKAGLDGDLSTLGEFVYGINYPIGKVYALASLDGDHLLVSSRQLQQQAARYDLSILNPFTEELKLVWTSSDLLEPHSLARTMDGQYAYAADISQDAYKKLFKFNVIQRAAH